MTKWARALYHPNLPLEGTQKVTAGEAHIALSRRAAEEGMVLLKNEGNVLPLEKNKTVAGVGRGIVDMVKGGGGTGDVHTPFVTTLPQGLSSLDVRLEESLLDYYQKDIKRQYAEGAVPGMTVEPPVPVELLDEAASQTDTALIGISRFSGEGWDRVNSGFENPEESAYKDMEKLVKVAAKVYPRGDFYLTEDEQEMVEAVLGRFKRVIVVLNIGGIIDLRWIKHDPRIQGALLMWQGGTDGGTAAASVLTGETCPSGRLPDTFAGELTDYPGSAGFHESPWYVDYTEDIYVGYRYFETFPEAAKRVLYPFGYGLSYTSFMERLVDVEEDTESITFRVQVANEGVCPGRHVTAIYYQGPQGLLGRPARELGAFGKTGLLLPGESELLTLRIEKRQMAAFDDLGKIAAYSWVLEAGVYHFYLGCCVRDAGLLEYRFEVPETKILETLTDCLSPRGLKERLRADGTLEKLPVEPETDLNACMFEKLIPGQDDGRMPRQRSRETFLRHAEFAGVHPLLEVAEGRVSMDEFVEQLSDEDLLDLLGGTPNTGVANTNGVGGIPEYGVPSVMTADGNAGVRINPEYGVRTTAWPCQTLLASTWDEELVREVGKAVAREMKENNLQIWLAPGLNIHRGPICGRNFEYYSEDPYLAGKMGAATVEGVQSQGIAACVKHFACNDKETNRMNSDSRVSLRALREIHLRSFEIAVREADPWTLMLGYNALNGYRCAENRELITNVLRGEWGYEGLVLSDWWDRSEHYKQILAGNDVKMPLGYPERVKKAMEMGALGRDDLKRCAKRVLALICKLD